MADMPLYIQYANELRKEILSGKFGTEGGLPGIDELVKRSKLASNTVYRSLALLVGEKLIEQRDRAYYVNRIPIQMTQYVAPVAVRMKKLDKEGYIKNTTRVERVSLPEHFVDKVKGEKGASAVLQVCVLGEIEGGTEHPTQYSHYYFLLPLSNEQIQHLQDDATFDPLLEGAPIGLTRHDEITSRPPTEEEIEILKLPSTASVIVVLSVVRDESGNLYLIQEDAMTARVVLAYDYTFENRPKS